MIQVGSIGSLYVKEGKDLYLLVALTKWLVTFEGVRKTRGGGIPGLQDLSGEIEGCLVGPLKKKLEGLGPALLDFRDRRNGFSFGGPAYVSIEIEPGRVSGCFRAAGVWKGKFK